MNTPTVTVPQAIDTTATSVKVMNLRTGQFLDAAIPTREQMFSGINPGYRWTDNGRTVTGFPVDEIAAMVADAGNDDAVVIPA